MVIYLWRETLLSLQLLNFLKRFPKWFDLLINTRSKKSLEISRKSYPLIGHNSKGEHLLGPIKPPFWVFAHVKWQHFDLSLLPQTLAFLRWVIGSTLLSLGGKLVKYFDKSPSNDFFRHSRWQIEPSRILPSTRIFPIGK